MHQPLLSNAPNLLPKVMDSRRRYNATGSGCRIKSTITYYLEAQEEMIGSRASTSVERVCRKQTALIDKAYYL